MSEILGAISLFKQKKPIDIDKAFAQLQCFDCRRTLTRNTPYTHYEGKPICFTCLRKIEAQNMIMKDKLEIFLVY